MEKLYSGKSIQKNSLWQIQLHIMAHICMNNLLKIHLQTHTYVYTHLYCLINKQTQAMKSEEVYFYT